MLGDNSQRIVYICTGPTAYAYHYNSNCSGLNRCSGQVKELSENKAIDMGRKAYQICGPLPQFIEITPLLSSSCDH